jgi:hypothetical protein
MLHRDPGPRRYRTLGRLTPVDGRVIPGPQSRPHRRAVPERRLGHAFWFADLQDDA